MSDQAYQNLAHRLNTLPNGFPPTDDGVELQLLALLFSPPEAELTSKLRITLETSREIAARLDRDFAETKSMLKNLLRKGLIRAGRATGGFGYGILAFAVGIYEHQASRIDAKFARLFESYYLTAYGEMLSIEPALHRVIPVNETVRNDLQVLPYENATSFVENANAWGVVDCLCRKQKALVGDPCDHPLDVCMIFHQHPGAFDDSTTVHAQTKAESLDTLKRAADAGLVHSVSNSQSGDTHFASYICNCCTCSCGILRGMADLGLANVVARSAFVNQVEPDDCNLCEDCIEFCQFDALSTDSTDLYIQINESHCVGCGVCVPACPDHALTLVRRPEDQIKPIPATHEDWLDDRAVARGIDINQIL